MNFLYFTLGCLFIIIIEVTIFNIIFFSENKLAKKIVRYLMKRQGIPYAKTMADVDERIDEMFKKDEKNQFK